MELPVIDVSDEVLPPLYARWAKELLRGAIPPETEASCDDCAMCAEDSSSQSPAGFFFDQSIKCCTFVPTLHNFVIGQILSDPDPLGEAGRQSVLNRLDEGVEITPLGAGHDPTYRALYAQMASAGAFGRSRHIRCPHFIEETGACGIWRHREAVCSTWFCKHVRGGVGNDFWRMLKELLGYIESELVRWCVVELDLGNSAFRRLFAGPMYTDKSDPIRDGELDGKPDQQVFREIWGRWAGKEKQFYVQCGELVDALSWADALELSGTKGRVLGQLVTESYSNLLSDALPPRIRAASFELLRTGSDYSQVITHNACDPIEVPRAVLEVLHYFDGRPTDQAIQDISQERGVDLDVSLVRKLVDFHILMGSQ